MTEIAFLVNTTLEEMEKIILNLFKFTYINWAYKNIKYLPATTFI